MITKPRKNPEKVTASYRLPARLVEQVQIRAAKERTRPCRVVEQILATALHGPKADALVTA